MPAKTLKYVKPCLTRFGNGIDENNRTGFAGCSPPGNSADECYMNGTGASDMCADTGGTATGYCQNTGPSPSYYCANGSSTETCANTGSSATYH